MAMEIDGVLCVLPVVLVFSIGFTDQTFSLIIYDHHTFLAIRDHYSLYISASHATKPTFPAEIHRVNRSTDGTKDRRSTGRRSKKRARHIILRCRVFCSRMSKIRQNTMDDIRAWIAFQWDIRDCNILCVKESW
jgi:hypothetical protein